MARSAGESAPATWVRSGRFPYGALDSSAPAAVVAARHVAATLLDACTDAALSKSGLAAEAGVSRSALYALIAGEVFPDFVTVARLGEALGVSLWPRG